MASILALTCTIDGLAFDLNFLQELSDRLAAFSVGDSIDYWTDHSLTCPNGHSWAVNFHVEFVRQA